MARKLKGGLRQQEEGLADRFKGVGHKLFLAGLGAAAKAIEEGPRLFETLVREGVDISARTDQQPTGKRPKPQGHWEQMEQIFEDRVSRALEHLNVPTQEDIQALQQQIQSLQTAVNNLTKSQCSDSHRAKDKD